MRATTIEGLNAFARTLCFGFYVTDGWSCPTVSYIFHFPLTHLVGVHTTSNFCSSHTYSRTANGPQYCHVFSCILSAPNWLSVIMWFIVSTFSGAPKKQILPRIRWTFYSTCTIFKAYLIKFNFSFFTTQLTLFFLEKGNLKFFGL